MISQNQMMMPGANAAMAKMKQQMQAKVQEEVEKNAIA